jgi:hypothetical protein
VDKIEQQALQVTKEIVVKFIEVGRISPTNFSEIFPAVYRDVLDAVTGSAAPGKDKAPGDAEG